jgi:hypothetical protein
MEVLTMNDTTDSDSDWFEDIALVARHFKNGPSQTYKPVQLERPPAFIDLGSVIDLPAAIARWELAIEGRALIPIIALWKAKVLEIGNQEEPDDCGDDLLGMFWTLTGQRAVEDVMMEIGWIGGDPDSDKGGPSATADDVMLYCKEMVSEAQWGPWSEFMSKYDKGDDE